MTAHASAAARGVPQLVDVEAVQAGLQAGDVDGQPDRGGGADLAEGHRAGHHVAPQHRHGAPGQPRLHSQLYSSGLLVRRIWLVILIYCIFLGLSALDISAVRESEVDECKDMWDRDGGRRCLICTPAIQPQSSLLFATYQD